MASLTIDKRGNAAVYILTPDGRRRPVRLGKVGRQRAERIRGNISELEAAARRGIEPTAAARAWLLGIKGELRERLASAGLCESAELHDVTLGDFAATWLAMKGKTVKSQTLVRVTQGVTTLKEYFTADRKLASIKAGDADEWRAWALGERKRRLAEATLRKRTSDARELFAFAIRKGAYTSDNPFGHLPAANVVNKARSHYIDEPTAYRVLDALQGAGSVPTWELRLLFGLARWGGMRVPSEPTAVRWTDVDFDAGSIRVDSPKTGVRIVPMFPELRPLLMDAFEQTEPGQAHVLPSLQRLTVTALRKHLHAAIRRAGMVEWPKLWINLRASRETDLGDRFPLQAVVAWIGNSERVAAKHYLQVTDQHFEAAVSADDKAVRFAVRAGGAGDHTERDNPALNRAEAHGGTLKDYQVTGVGLEPTTSGLKGRCSTD
jgi:integrase